MISTRSLICGYALAINAGAFGLFYHDKQQAINHRWRVPEKTLQLSALAGGWLGGIMAINTFKHKTRKEPFRTIYGGCVLANIGIIGGGLALLWKNPMIMTQILGRQSSYKLKRNKKSKNKIK